MAGLARSPAATLEDLRGRVRRYLGDTAADVGSQRWLDAEIDEGINNQAVEMQTTLDGMAPGEALVRVNVAYGADADAADLPAECNLESVYRVENLNDPKRPIPILGVSALEIENYVGASGNYVPVGARAPALRYSILASPSGAAQADKRQIVLRPRPSGGVTLRIAYLAPPFVLGVAADKSPFSSRWTEALAMGAALKLRSPFGSATPDQVAEHEKKERSFRAFAEKMMGPFRVRRRRRGRS